MNEWHENFRRVALMLAKRGVPFTSEDITERVGLPVGKKAQHKNNAVGAAIGHLSREGVIVKTGHRVKMRRADGHAYVHEWVGKKSQPLVVGMREGQPYRDYLLAVTRDEVRAIQTQANKAIKLERAKIRKVREHHSMLDDKCSECFQAYPCSTISLLE